MASLVDSSTWSIAAAKPTSFMLKDFLQDDFSSCSSNGFRSFPRSQCCTTTVRFLLHNDLKRTDSSVTKTFPPPTASTRIALPAVSTLQKASHAVVRAFKQFPLPRSISRKLILISFWKKSDVVDSNTKRWKSFQEFLDEKEPPSSSDHDHADSADSTAMAIAGRNSICSCSNSISWTEKEFTSEMIPSSSSGNLDSCSEIDAAKDDKDSPGNHIAKRDGIAFGKDSIEETTAATYPEKAIKQLGNEEEKEQLSPVSVLDFRLKQQKHGGKTKRSEKGGELEGLELKKGFGGLISRKEGQREQKALEVLRLVKSRTKWQWLTLKTENLVLDFIHEKLEEDECSSARRGCGFEEEKVVKLIEGWVDGMGGVWAEGGSLYIKDMEKGGKWRSLGGEKEELAAEVETEVWMCLVDELLVGLC